MDARLAPEFATDKPTRGRPRCVELVFYPRDRSTERVAQTRLADEELSSSGHSYNSGADAGRVMAVGLGIFERLDLSRIRRHSLSRQAIDG